PRPVPKPRAAPKPRTAPRPEPQISPRNQRPIGRTLTLRDRANPVEGPGQLDLFPGDGRADAVVVGADWDCAREDQLHLFIPDERLEAARFDGLTLILRDVTHDPQIGQTTVYGERPLYVPPNYIEGFLLARRNP
ncbi:MAG: hypothetical protein WBF53_08210, partial [Litorimonas sp.]